MLTNRSVPDGAVIPVLYYDDPGAAADWLCRVFGFTERLRAGNDHIQLAVDLGAGRGGLMLSINRTGQPVVSTGQYVHLEVADVDAHFARVTALGGDAAGSPPAEYPYGERQYGVTDPFGHRWVFSQSIADVDPTKWGASVKG